MIPKKDSELVPWTTNFNDRIVAAPATFGLTAPQAAAYTPLSEAFVDAYQALVNARADGTYSRSMTAAKNTAKDDLLLYARQLYKFVQSNEAVSDADKILLGVHVPNQPSPIPRPAVAPGVDLIGVTGRTVKLHVHDSASTAKRGKPAGATAAWVYSFVGAEYPSDPLLWNFEGATTQPKFDVIFPPEVVGGTQVWVCAAWINGKQEAGPPSTPITTTLQGGGASVQSAELKVAA